LVPLIANGGCGWQSIKAGELAVAYQNFFICLEMFFAAVMLLYGFPYSEYAHNDGMGATLVSRYSVARNLKAVGAGWPCGLVPFVLTWWAGGRHSTPAI
jgi:hypothetical protein